MADNTNVITINDDDTPVGLVNQWQAKEYAEGLDWIITEFHQLIEEDRKDVLITTIRALKWHMSSQFDIMNTVDVNIVPATVQDPKCMHLWQALQEEGVQNFYPDEEVPKWTGNPEMVTAQTKNTHQQSGSIL